MIIYLFILAIVSNQESLIQTEKHDTKSGVYGCNLLIVQMLFGSTKYLNGYLCRILLIYHFNIN